MKTTFNATQAADSHAGQHGDFYVYWINHNPPYLAGWYWQADNYYGDGDGDGDGDGPFETSQAAFLAFTDRVDQEIRAGLAQS